MTIKEFKKRKQLNGGYDRKLDEWEIIDIHQIPDPLSEEHEVGFYCCNHKNAFLLRLRNREVENYTIVDKHHIDLPIYFIAELPIDKIDDALLKKVLLAFNKYYR